jgi:hypothetical protein
MKILNTYRNTSIGGNTCSSDDDDTFGFPNGFCQEGRTGGVHDETKIQRRFY